MNTLEKLAFTKMQGAGNDFVVLNNLQNQLDLSPQLIRRLADRHFGIGADQVLLVERAVSPENDFRYRIFNADGQEVQQCGNGARCFAQYVIEKKLTTQSRLRVETVCGVIEPEVVGTGQVRVNMGEPVFSPTALPFDAQGLQTRMQGGLTQYELPLQTAGESENLWVSVVSMGNPHVVIHLTEPPSDETVQRVGTLLEGHPRFPERVNVGFLQILDRNTARLRVFERGVGETLACGTGACAAVVCGVQMGQLAHQVDVIKKGGTLTIAWSAQQGVPVFMTGPASTVFEGEFYV